MQILEELTVGEAYHPDRSPLMLIGPDEEFANVVQRLARQPDLRGAFVVDDEKRLLGVITRTDLLDWARAKLGASLQAPFHGAEKTLRLASLINASTAGQVIHSSSNGAAVTEVDSLAHTLRLMVALDLIVLPVVDGFRRVIGEVRLSDILAQAIEGDPKSISD
jgi:CBS domain-containing protein